MQPRFAWHTRPVPPGLAVTQVYGFCFDGEGRVLVLESLTGRCGLPGGHPEPKDRSYEQTLRRECMEEARILLSEPLYLGYQEVVAPDAGEAYAQIRMLARIKRFTRRQPDPSSGETLRRRLVPINKVPGLLNWGVDGLLQAAEAARVAEKCGIPIRRTRQEIYRD